MKFQMFSAIAWASLAAAPSLGQQAAAARAQQAGTADAANPGTLSYADLADLAAAAPVVATATIRDALRLKDADAAGVPAGLARFYVEADVAALIRGAGGLPGQVRYLVDVPLDARGRAPKLRKARVILLASPVEGRPGELRLVAPDAQLPWTAGDEARLRGILTALNAADAPPQVTGINNAFHVPGAVPGESETQIFLATADQRPVSLNILRRPGESPRWAVALGEMVDDAARPPERDTLLWYRLACALPDELPERATASLAAAEAEAARADYRLVREGLGACGRTRGG